MTNMICDECETVAHCMKNGCVPKTNVQQEPVAWMQDSIELYVQDHPSEYYTIPLYTSPPTLSLAQRKPLTDEQLQEIEAAVWGAAFLRPQSARQFARAIEAAHGIKENT